MKTKELNPKTGALLQKILLITNLSLLVIILALPIFNETNHIGFEPYYLIVPLLITATTALILDFFTNIEKSKSFSIMIFASLIGILMLYSYNRFNILLNYDEWITRGKPNSLLMNVTDDSSTLTPQKLGKTSEVAKDSKVRDLIIANLRDKDVKGDIESEIQITKLDSAALYDNTKIELYTVTLDYAWLYSTYMIKDESIITSQSGVEVFIADLDNDGSYEVYTNYSVGSGIVSDHIGGYNTKTQESYTLGTRFENNTTLSLKYGELVVRIEKYDDPKDSKQEKLVITQKDDRTKLETK